MRVRGTPVIETGPPLLEREASLALLTEQAAQAARGEGRLVLLSGEAGVGKSALVQRLCRDLPDAHWSRRRAGFAILEPVADGRNDAIIGPSVSLGADLRSAFLSGTGEPFSSYDGTDGIQPRDDLAGINLSIVPKVFIECANMRNASDATLVTSLRWQAAAARAIAAGLTAFLTRAG